MHAARPERETEHHGELCPVRVNFESLPSSGTSKPICAAKASSAAINGFQCDYRNRGSAHPVTSHEILCWVTLVKTLAFPASASYHCGCNVVATQANFYLTVRSKSSFKNTKDITGTASNVNR